MVRRAKNGGISFYEPIDLADWPPGVAHDAPGGDADSMAGRSPLAPVSALRQPQGVLPDRRKLLTNNIAVEVGFAARRVDVPGE